MPRRLDDAVVVVTGASSGIGRAAALRFASRGSALALCARSPEPLKAVASECEERGCRGVLVRALDVTDEEAVESLAVATEERFGRLDVWVNNAGSMAYGRFADIPTAVFRGVIETNLMGQVHGARAAMRRFEAQDSGVLINMSSVWGTIASPQVSPYIVSKNAVRALSECIRAELPPDGDIHVVAIAPQAVDTPIFLHAGNYTGRSVRPIPPVLTADHVAAGIERCAESPKPKVSFGRAGRTLELLYTLVPGFYRRLAHGAFVRGTAGPEQRPSKGNVLAPADPHQVDGEWRKRAPGTLTRAFFNAAVGGVAGLLGAAAWAQMEND